MAAFTNDGPTSFYHGTVSRCAYGPFLPFTIPERMGSINAVWAQKRLCKYTNALCKHLKGKLLAKSNTIQSVVLNSGINIYYYLKRLAWMSESYLCRVFEHWKQLSTSVKRLEVESDRDSVELVDMARDVTRQQDGKLPSSREKKLICVPIRLIFR
ncbi:hypothetical protein J6590_075826 [Homalodisca vitripennis]|nr:hypothetical protein J6590_075826 [Homalodisca vitripennis]